MDRSDRATGRAEFAARFARLLELAPTGAQALAAQGAMAVIWHHDATTAAGYLPKGPGEVAQLLGVDARTWRDLAGLLEGARMLTRSGAGYQVHDSAALEGALPDLMREGGFLRTHRPEYSRHAAALAVACQGSGRGATVLAALGAFEVLRVVRVNWRTGVAVWRGTAAAAALGVTRGTWRRHLGALERAGLVARAGARLQLVAWRVLSWGSEGRRRAAAEVSRVHNLRTSLTERVHRSRTLSTAKSRPGVTNIPPTPAVDRGAGDVRSQIRTRRGDHPQLPELLQSLAERLPGATHLRWRGKVREEFSYALTVTGGDVPALVAELTARETANVRNLPGVLAYRCQQAVEKVAQKTASQEARRRANEAREVSEVIEAQKRAQIAAERDFGARVASSAPSDWSKLLETVAQDLGRARPGTPGWTPATRGMVEAVARDRVRGVLGQRCEPATADLKGSQSAPLERAELAQAVRAALEAGPDAQS